MVALEIPSPGIGLFLSSSGGHFTGLRYVAERFRAKKDSIFVTFETFDTKLESFQFEIRYFPYVQSRKILPLLRMTPSIYKIVKMRDFEYIASTGAGIAIIGYFLAKIKGIPFYYVEDFNRQTALSMTARILRMFGLRKIFVQSKTLANGLRTYFENPIDRFEVRHISQKNLKKSHNKILVALGTIQGFDFSRAVKIVLSLIENSDEIDWQIGSMIIQQDLVLPGNVHNTIAKDQFLQLLSCADLVICHGGNGIIAETLATGKIPLVIPRRASFGEHIDDHQVEMVQLLAERGLVINLETHQFRTELNELLQNRTVSVNQKN